jgi:hypothetical protein
MTEPADCPSTLKIDLYPDEVSTFTPQGKVITLPRDASPEERRRSELLALAARRPHQARWFGRIYPLLRPAALRESGLVAAAQGDARRARAYLDEAVRAAARRALERVESREGDDPGACARVRGLRRDTRRRRPGGEIGGGRKRLLGATRP